jgi:transposase
MKEYHKSSVGIDISKHHLDVYHLPSGEYRRYKNTLPEVQQCIKWLKDSATQRIVFEPSGGYEKLLRQELSQQKQPFSMVNAAMVRYFARAKGVLVKTDKVDAVVLAEYGERLDPRHSSFECPDRSSLKEWLSVRRHVIEQIKIETQRLEHTANHVIIDFIHQTIRHYREQQSIAEEHIRNLISATPTFLRVQQVLMEEKGVGEVTAATLIADCPELGVLTHPQISALIGVAPYSHDSGTHAGLRRTKGGRKRIRNALYMSVISAIRSNPKIKAFYQRLRSKGKKAKVAITACIHKLIIILNAKLRNHYHALNLI